MHRFCSRICLRLKKPSRSFAFMRVQAVSAIPRTTSSAAAHAADPGTSLALKNFVAAMGSEDSLFVLLEPLLGLGPAGSDQPHECYCDVVLGFQPPELARQKSLYLLLVEKLVELLKSAGSPETLAAKLCLLSETRDVPSLPQTALCIRLIAFGDSSEQAGLRWALGLAHLQQALLFTSRLLRQQVKQAG
jgi:hypothetical protein